MIVAPPVSRRSVALDIPWQVHGIAAAVLTIGCIFEFLGNNLADPDLWGHILYGQRILTDLEIPSVDNYSFTASGAAWLNHEWLSEVLFAWIFSLATAKGLIVFKLMLGAVTALCWIQTARLTVGSLNPILTAGLLVPLLAASEKSFYFRPQLFTTVGLSVLCLVLTRAEHPRRSSFLLAVPPILAVWANLHGGFIAGVGTALIWGTAYFLLRARRRRTAALVFVAALLAPLVNPYGYQLYSFLFRTLDDHGYISEWAPIPIFSAKYLIFKLCAVGSMGALLYLLRCISRNKRLMPTLAWRGPLLLLTLALALRHHRHTILFLVVAAPLVLAAAELMRRRLALSMAEGQPSSFAVLAVLLAFVWMGYFQLRTYSDRLDRHGSEITYDRMDFPVNALEFLRVHGIQGNVLLPFEWGQFGIWKLGPQSRVFIDGRFETVYPQTVVDDYFEFSFGRPGWERVLDHYPTEIVVVQRFRQLHEKLFARADFQYVYSDPSALVFVRRSPTMAVALEQLANSPDRLSFAWPATVFP